MDDISVPDNTACVGLEPIPGRTIIAPTTANLGIGWIFDSRHGEPQFLVDDRIMKGDKFYVMTGCAAYKTYSKTHRSSFCYIMERAVAIQQMGPPNTVSDLAPPQNITTGNIGGGVQLPGYKPLESHSFNFATCAKGFSAD
jgi:hypothetical protein